jgi:hypothetical protein
MYRHAWILIALLCGCGDDDDPGTPGRDAGRDGGRPSMDGGGRDGGRDGGEPNEAGVMGRPTTLVLQGTAEGSADEDAGSDRVECRFMGTIEQIEYEPNGDFTGLVSAELFRTIYVDDGQFEFIPFVAGPATVTHTSDDEIELRFVGDQPDDAMAFWQELEVVTGEDRGDDRYGGTWQCAPILLGDPGFMDIEVTAAGEWTLEPP